jgi:hypothetical protein
MATGGTAQQPADYERTYLSKLEREYQQLSAPLDPPNYVPTLQHVDARINLYDAWVQYFQTYERLAKYLADAGLPRLSERVTHMRKDVQGALDIYLQIRQDMLKSQAQIAQVWVDTNQECIRIVAETNARRQQVFERCMEMRRNLLL